MTNLFRQEKETKAIKDRTLTDIKNLFEHEEEKIIINQWEYVIFRETILLNMKVTMIEIKHYQLKNILIKLDHI